MNVAVEKNEISYMAEPTLQRFHADHSSFYRVVRGPVGSGKSTGCCMEIMKRALEQNKNPITGLRHSRFCIIRNTYRQLEDTVIKTWSDWFREDYFGKINKNSFSQKILVNDIELEILFRALDRPDHVRNLLSLELTGGWVNEGREIPKDIIDALGDRVGRYPAKKDGGSKWRGVIIDTNAPDEDHYLSAMEKRDNELLEKYDIDPEEIEGRWNFFIQPGGLIEDKKTEKFFPNSNAENLNNLEDDYYINRMPGKSKAHIRVYYCNQLGFVADGKPVYPEFNEDIHVAKKTIEPNPGIPSIAIGQDFGLTPAACLGQRLPSGQIVIFMEKTTENMGIQRFARSIKPIIKTKYPDHSFEVFADPAGNIRQETDEKTSFDILRSEGFKVSAAAPNNNWTLRLEASSAPFRRMIDGEPGILFSPECKDLIKALKGGYHYKRVRVAGEARFENKPYKNKFSHIADAFQYLTLGLGEGELLKGSTGLSHPFSPERSKSTAPNTTGVIRRR